MTVHCLILQPLCDNFWLKKISQRWIIRHTHLICLYLIILFPKIKIKLKGRRFEITDIECCDRLAEILYQGKFFKAHRFKDLKTPNVLYI